MFKRGASRIVPLLCVWGAWIFTCLQRSNTDIQVIGSYSRSLLFTILAYLGISLVITAWVFRPASFRFPQRFFRPELMLTVFVVSGFLLWAVITARVEVKIFPTVVLLFAASAVLEQSASDSRLKWLEPLPIVLMVLGLLIQFIILLQVPSIHTHDEGAYSAMALMSLRTGTLSGALYGYPPRHFIGFGWWLTTLGIWIQIFGFGWWAGRFYAFCLTLLSVPFVYLSVRNLYGKASAVFAVAFLVLSQTFSEAHRIRPDGFMLFMVSLSLFIFVTQWRRSTRWSYFWLGAISALTLEVHLIGLAFWGTWAVWLGLRWLYQSWSARKLVSLKAPVSFVLGSLPPFIFFFVAHILPDMGLPNAIVLSPNGINVLHALQKEITRWTEYPASFPLEALITVWALGLAIWRRQAEDKLLLGVTLLVMLAYMFIAPMPWPQYTRYFLPLQALFVGGMLVGRRALKPALASLTAVILFGWLVSQGLSVLPEVAANGIFRRPIPPIVDYISENVPPGSTLVMNMYYYLDFDRGDRYHYLNISIHPPTINQLGGPPVADVWKEIAPDVIVLDQKLDEHNVWMDDYLREAHFVKLTNFSDQGFEIYVPPDSPLAK